MAKTKRGKIIKRGRKAQSHLPFGIIFSIILIIFFIAFAFYAIRIFLGWRDCSQFGLFKDDLQKAVDRALNSEESSEKYEGVLPSEIKEVCFLDSSQNAKPNSVNNKEKYEELVFYKIKSENMFFYEPEKACQDMEGFYIKSINITKITKTENPFCIENKKGKASLIIKKEFGESLVRIEGV